MTIDADVRTTAQRFGLEPRFLQAIVNAEGDILRAVRCSIPSTKDRQTALEITCRSAIHAMRDFITAYGFAETYVEFFGSRWAPIGAGNDPTSLNKNWVPNVYRLWRGHPPVKATGEVPNDQ